MALNIVIENWENMRSMGFDPVEIEFAERWRVIDDTGTEPVAFFKNGTYVSLYSADISMFVKFSYLDKE